jgi:hypothetical protein
MKMHTGGLTGLAVAMMMCSGLTGTAFPAGTAAWPNWGTERSELTSGPGYDESKAICRAVGVPRAPVGDMPTPAQRAALRDCRSEPLYYGEGVPVDDVDARLCAFVETEDGDEQTFGGSTILMQIYANGLGVPRDLDLATAYACQIKGAPAESNGRVMHLQALKAQEPTSQGVQFDYCNDVTSGWAGSECEARASTLAAFTRDAKIAALEAQLPEASRKSYRELRQALEAYIEMHGDGEVDQAGSGRAGFVIQEQDAVRDQFLTDLGLLLTNNWPVLDATGARDADVHLNALYRETLAWAASKSNLSTVHPDAIRKAERAWLRYRDAFVRFAGAACPALNRDAVLAHLTQVRNMQLGRIAV